MQVIGHSQSVQSLSHVRLFETPWTAAHQASLSISNSQSLLKLMSIELVMPSNHLILCQPLLLLPSIFPSIRVFSSASGGQSNGASTSASVLPMNIQGWFPLGLTGVISVILDMLINFSDPWFSYLYKGKLLTISQYCCKLFETIYASASLGPESLCCFSNASENLKLKGDVLSCHLLLLML